MAYTRTTWVEEETPLSAQNMNNIEDGIEELQAQKVDKVSGKALSDNNYTDAEKTKLAGIAAGAEVNVQSDWNQSDTDADDFIKNKPGNATTSAAGFMSTSDKSKLDGIAAGAEVNQNAFSNVKVGETIVAADGKTDTLELAAGSNVTLTPDTTNDKVTIAATDTKYTFSSDSIYLSNSTSVISVGAGNHKELSFSRSFPSETILGILGIDFRTTTNALIYGLAITGIVLYANAIGVRVQNLTDSEIKVSTANSKVIVMTAATA